MIADRIRTFLLTEPDFRVPQDLPDTYSLINSGAVDSFSIVKLLAFIEETFQIKVEPEDLSEKNFDTVNNIEAYVLEKTRGPK
jgi:acyl carrier protein